MTSLTRSATAIGPHRNNRHWSAFGSDRNVPSVCIRPNTSRVVGASNDGGASLKMPPISAPSPFSDC